MNSDIKRWGNSAAVRIPSKILAQAGLDISRPISIDVKAGRIVIEAFEKTRRKVVPPFTESDLLKGLDVGGAHAEELALPSATEMGVDGSVYS